MSQPKLFVRNPKTNRFVNASGKLAQRLAKDGLLSPEDLAKVTIRDGSGAHLRGIRTKPVKVEEEYEESYEDEEPQSQAPAIRKKPISSGMGKPQNPKKSKSASMESEKEYTYAHQEEDEDSDVDTLREIYEYLGIVSDEEN